MPLESFRPLRSRSGASDCRPQPRPERNTSRVTTETATVMTKAQEKPNQVGFRLNMMVIDPAR